MKILVAYDGTLQSKEALVYGMEKAREKKAELLVLSVFNTDMFIDYDATPNAETMARAESSLFIEQARSIIREKGKGLKTSLVLGEGNPEEEVISYAKAENVDIMLCPPKYKNIIRKYKKILSREARETSESELFDAAKNLKLSVLSVPAGSKAA
jgi:coenzyme F420-reducing hydrogenase gamma subunit